MKYPEVIEAELSDTIDDDESYYFITLLHDRFSPLNNRWAQSLEKRYGKKFKPIYILPSRHNELFKEDNFIVINRKLQKQLRTGKNKNLVSIIYLEDLNKQFSESPFCRQLLNRLIQKQGQVFVLSFSSVWLSMPPGTVILGPDPVIAERLDSKTAHFEVFRELGFPTVAAQVHADFKSLRENQQRFPCFVSPTFTSGGIESRIVTTQAELEDFYKALRPVNRQQPMVAAELLTDIVGAYNSTALVDNKKAVVINVSEQILREQKYLGNIYPSGLSANYHQLIIDMTTKLGDYLRDKGFRGLFGCDFLITARGQCIPIDLNPRRQGGYLCIALASETNLIELEFRVVLGESLPKISYDDFQVDYAWGHSKLLPYHTGQKIAEEIRDNDSESLFKRRHGRHRAQYYPKGHVLTEGNPGFYLRAGQTRDDVARQLSKDVEATIQAIFKT